jgi:hypothetical protein
MANVFGSLQPGGSFVLLALRGCKAYRAGTEWFPAANIQSDDLESVLLQIGADPASLEVAERGLSGHAGQGYEGILMAAGHLATTRRRHAIRHNATSR